MKILSAEFLLPVSSPPIENGALAIDAGRIVRVGEKKDLAEEFPGSEFEDFGRAAILPGLVNCHTHLELTVMRGFLDRFDDDFFTWLIALTKTRRDDLTEEDLKISALLGALEGARAGVTCFGDIGRFGRAGFEALRKCGLRGVLFQETEFSPDDRTAERAFDSLKTQFQILREGETELVEAGLSPHAPYTVSPKLFEKIAEYALRENVKISIHAAESLEEQNLMEHGTGFFADLYEEREVHWQSPNLSSVEFLKSLGVLETRPLLAHCVHVSGRDIEIIRQTGSKIAHCPKSNAKFGHGVAPFEKFLDEKIPVGFGSDSVASNNRCDILEEARFATFLARTRVGRERFPSAEELIRAATLGGAEALGLDDRIGTLEAGKQADLTVISLEHPALQPVHDVCAALVFSASGEHVRLTLVAGEEVCRDGLSAKIDEDELKSKVREIAGKM